MEEKTFNNTNTTVKSIGIKIKTAPLTEEILKIKPFNAEDVKIGNLTDPVKIQNKIDTAAQLHKENIAQESCLKSTTCYINYIGIITSNILNETQFYQLKAKHFSEESNILNVFWAFIESISDKMKAGDKINLYTYNGQNFDLPIILQRSIINRNHDVVIKGDILPKSLLNITTYGWNTDWCNNYDLMKIWNCKNYTQEKFLNIIYALNLYDTEDYDFINDHMLFNQANFYKLDDLKAQFLLNKELKYLNKLFNILIM